MQDEAGMGRARPADGRVGATNLTHLDHHQDGLEANDVVD